VPARLSARFCASLQLNGELAHDLLELPAGYLKGRTGFLRVCDGAPAVSGNGDGHLSETAGADAFGLTLNPLRGPA
jgi:hypothetical protein